MSANINLCKLELGCTVLCTVVDHWAPRAFVHSYLLPHQLERRVVIVA